MIDIFVKTNFYRLKEFSHIAEMRELLVRKAQGLVRRSEPEPGSINRQRIDRRDGARGCAAPLRIAESCFALCRELGAGHS